MRYEKSIYHAAIYMRLSSDDGDKAESDSIQNQRILLKDYINSHPGFELAGEFVDDGYSGTSFDRPGFQKMMDQIRNQKIDCIIVKDLSRLGRNYIETGKYLERIFPALGVRFIAITDNYDSANDHSDADDIIIPFKNLINDAYCRDISIKIRSQLEVKRKNGQFVGSFAPYGYKKDPRNINHLLVDEPAAEVVREIFDLKLEGYNPTKIAEKLNEKGVLTPFEYKRACGFNYNSGYYKSDVPVWNHVIVGRLLKNEVYIGTVVQGKNMKINYKVKKLKPIDKEDWVRVPNMHEPIIPKHIFDIVQKLMQMDTRTSPYRDKVLPLSGFVYCADCGQYMQRRSMVRNGKRYNYLYCATFKNRQGCSSHQINADRLDEMALHAIQKQISVLLDAEKILGGIDSFPQGKPRLNSYNQKIMALEDEIRHYQKLKEKLYEDFRADVIDIDEYEDLKYRFMKKMDQAFEAQGKLEARRQEEIKGSYLLPEWMNDIREYQNLTTLTRKAVVMLLEEIKVYSKDRVEFRFRYADEIREYVMAAEKMKTDIEEAAG